MRIAAYIRVSTDQQTAENQLPAIMDYCKAHWWPEPEICVENESAWRNGHQKELARLRHEIQSGKRKYDYLVVWALDRLSRQGISATLQLINSFEALGCKVVSTQESCVAESGPMREVFAAMAAWAAKFESDRRSERTRAGLDRARAEGKRLGRPKGSKDNGRRKRTGYLLRYANKG
jgi:putative DNA-invertase from lambdoid prophage Rac